MVRVLARRLVRLTAVLLPLVALSLAGAAPGDLDTTFGPAAPSPGPGIPGIVVVAVDSADDGAFAVAIQPDGNIVVGGRASGALSVFRLLPAGSLDPAFNGGAPVTTGSGEIQALAIQPGDGKIVAAARQGTTGFAVIRFNPDGTLDDDFDGDGGAGNGIVDTSFVGLADAWALALQADGKIVVAGEVGGHVALARYSGVDGTLDPGFGGTGQVVSSFGLGEGALAVAVQTDGKIVVAGSASVPDGSDFFVARFNANGTPDTTFNSPAGFVTTNFKDLLAPPPLNSRDVANGIAILPGGEILVTGYIEVTGGGDDNLVLARYSASGSLDATFGVGGRVKGPAGSGQALAVQPDGRIVVGGIGPSGHGDFQVARFLANGSIDTEFGTDGVISHDIGADAFDAITDMALQADGKIVAVGQGRSATSLESDSVIARYEGKDTVPPTIDSAGVSPSLLWPPNHKMVPVTVTVSAHDDVGPVTCSITGITSNEPVNGTGDGDTAPDWLITPPLSAQLRAERSGAGSGRIYSLTIECVDGADNATETTVAVTVPHSKKN